MEQIALLHRMNFVDLILELGTHQMDDITARLAALLRRYRADFRCMVDDAELHRATEAFRVEVDALIVDHGRVAVARAAVLLLPFGPPTLN
jgi:hypothetical protein